MAGLQWRWMEVVGFWIFIFLGLFFGIAIIDVLSNGYFISWIYVDLFYAGNAGMATGGEQFLPIMLYIPIVIYWSMTTNKPRFYKDLCIVLIFIAGMSVFVVIMKLLVDFYERHWR